jgi:uncharacterized protein (TIGR00730 family)
MRSICVFLGANGGNHDKYLKSAIELGKQIASQNITLVYGGANIGLMGALADAALHGGGEVIGVMPKPLLHQEIAHQNLTKLHIVDTVQQRKDMMFELADGFIALPGGLGTLEEVFEVWNAAKIGLHAKPIGFLNVDGYYDELFKFLNKASESGFFNNEHLELTVQEINCSTLVESLNELNYANTMTSRP